MEEVKQDAAPFDPDTFRQVLGHHAAGVVVITAATVEPVGFTATSFTSVSLYPPIVSFCVGRGSSSWSAMTSTAYLGVNLLSDGQADIARLFATRGADRFAAPVDWDADAYGVPVLDGVLASMICRRLHSVEVGDHAITLAEPLTGTHRVAADRSPLLYHRGRYTALVASAAAPLEGAHHGP
jgi:flavin reductase (DIM6/NTAB) family NADH-FMN oxidoreductase RutF